MSEPSGAIERDIERIAERVAREQVASLAGLVLRRSQEERPSRSFERNMAEETVNARLAQIFGEALADFSGHTGSGEQVDGHA